MARYEMLQKGKHHGPDGKVYTEGDIFESEVDLIRIFPKRFRKLEGSVDFVSAAPLASTKTISTSATIGANTMIAPTVEDPNKDLDAVSVKKTKLKKKSKTPPEVLDARGKNATRDFEVDDLFEVFERDDNFHVYEKGKTSPLNLKALKRSNVEQFVKKYLEE